MAPLNWHLDQDFRTQGGCDLPGPTKVFAEIIKGNSALLTLDDVIASDGGIPQVMGGKIVGAIGCSGATGAQDHQACEAGAKALQ
jgi:uncharacterized protein GlcG (DUF336 family)